MIGKLQFFLWSLDAGSKIELILIDFRVKMPNFMARKNTFSFRGNFLSSASPDSIDLTESFNQEKTGLSWLYSYIKTSRMPMSFYSYTTILQQIRHYLWRNLCFKSMSFWLHSEYKHLK